MDDAGIEHATLRDGTRVLVRPLRPSDREMLARGFERLSPESRYRRFFTDKERLSDAELRYLTELDGDRHIAIAAALEEDQSGIGVARCVRLPEDPLVAEPAVAVIDAYQGRGLGRLLLHRLEIEAWARGIRSFRALVLASNAPMLTLLTEVPPVRIQVAADDALEIEIALHPPDVAEAERAVGPLHRLMTMAARGVVQLLHAASRRPAG